MVITPSRGCHWGCYRFPFFTQIFYRPAVISNLDATHTNPRKRLSVSSIETPIDFDFLQG
jgi:hypothetical protein